MKNIVIIEWGCTYLYTRDNLPK